MKFVFNIYLILIFHFFLKYNLRTIIKTNRSSEEYFNLNGKRIFKLILNGSQYIKQLKNIISERLFSSAQSIFKHKI